MRQELLRLIEYIEARVVELDYEQEDDFTSCLNDGYIEAYEDILFRLRFIINHDRA